MHIKSTFLTFLVKKWYDLVSLRPYNITIDVKFIRIQKETENKPFSGILYSDTLKAQNRAQMHHTDHVRFDMGKVKSKQP